MNRFIAEKVMKRKWKEDTFEYVGCDCENDSPYRRITGNNPDYTTSADYFDLLMKARESEWWDRFVYQNRVKYSGMFDIAKFQFGDFLKWLLAPENFARLLAEYHGWEESGECNLAGD